MKKGFCFFFGFLLLLLGLQFTMMDRVFLTSQFTHALAKQTDPALSKKTFFYQAIFGEPAPIPEKEVSIPMSAGYVTMAFGTLCFMHGFGGKK